MAPTVSLRAASGEHLKTILPRSTSSSLQSLSPQHPASKTPIASVFAVVAKSALSTSRRALQDGVLASRSLAALEPLQPLLVHSHSSNTASLSKRQQNGMLAIPTTYAGLNSGPAPGAVVGIVLGSIAGFILVLYILLSAFRLAGWRQGTVIEEEIVHHRRRQPHSRSRTRSRSRSRTMTEISSPRREREVVEERREETVIVEEHMEPSVEEDDIVEVIEEHSPERPPKREPSRRSGYRTVDPAEFGGGGRPMRKISRR